jgi:hypothetical protein
VGGSVLHLANEGLDNFEISKELENHLLNIPKGNFKRKK